MAEVSVRNVRLSYGKIQALKDVSLEVEEGSLFGIIGPDGAGKTSLFRIMTTLIVPDSGSAHRLMCADTILSRTWRRYAGLSDICPGISRCTRI